jgi:hypothetical protein
MDLRINPDVISINTTSSGGFPPQQDAKVIGAQTGYFLYEFSQLLGIAGPTLFSGTDDPTTGYWDEVAESFIPSPSGGAGDYTSGLYPKLVTFEVTSKSDTVPCLIDIIDFEYRGADGVWRSPDVVEDGYYGNTPYNPPPSYMSYQGSLYPGGDPTGTRWHEIHPNYCHYYDLVGWTDNGDGDLTASDQIDMVNETGWTFQYHVDQVTTTIHWTFKVGGDPTGELAAAEPVENNLLDSPITDPIGTSWHQIYPPADYCKEFVITSWEDNGDGIFSISDQFDFEYFGEGTIHWAHLDDITTDILLSQKGEPEPPVPEFPLGAAVEVGLIVAVAYIWWTRRRRLKEVL